MKIKEIIEELSITGNTLSNVSKNKVGIGEKRLKSALHSAGFQYSNSHPKGWFYAGEGSAPIDSDIEEYFPSPRAAKRNESVRVNGEVQFTQFTPEEVAALKEMVGQYMNQKQNQTQREALHERIMNLEKSDKVRKTIVISDTVGQKLDDFAATTRFNKSDLLEIAILDLISRYE